MTLLWFIILIVYGLTAGWGSIHPLFWWMLLVFLFQDHYDIIHRR